MTNLKTLKTLIELLENTEVSKSSESKPEAAKTEAANSIDDFLLNEYVMIRAYSAGVFAGTLIRKVGNEVELHNARRIFYWEGAASLSQLAVDGTSAPTKCKIPAEVPKVLISGVIEILPISDKAKKSIAGVKIWTE